MISSLNSALPPISLAATLQTLTGPQPTAPQSTSLYGSSFAQLGTDSYTSSQSVSSSSVSQSVQAEYESYVSPTQQAWQTLQQSLASGDISSAQTALTDYTQSLSNSNLDMSPLTTPSAQFLKELSDMGNALGEGNLDQAQSLFKTAQQDQPQSVDQALATALANATNDGASDAWWMSEIASMGSGLPVAALSGGASGSSDASSGTQVNATGFEGDLETIEGLVRENNANFGDYLTSQGYAEGAVKAITTSLDVSQTLGMLSGLAYDIAQRGGPSVYEGTISNSSSATTVDASGTTVQGSTSTSDGSLFSSMSDSFNWTLAMVAVEPDTGAETAVVSSDSVHISNTTAASLQTSTAPSSADAASISEMNQTENLVKNTMGMEMSSWNYSYSASSAKYAVTSSGLSLYA